MRAVLAFVRLGRPRFLVGGFLMFALGAAIAAATGHAIDVHRYLLGQAVVTAFQLMTHYANDYFDLDADRANATPTQWSGGSRVLVAGELPRVAALAGALAFAGAGIASSAVLVVETRDQLLAATLAAIAALAWTYSAPPRLCARGLGELDTAAVVTGLVPWLGFYLHAPDLRGGGQLGLSIVSLVLLQIAMLLAIELPDAAGDAASAKRTLVVRLGAARASRLYAATVAAAFAWLPLAYVLGLPARVALAAGLVAPVGAWRIVRAGEHAHFRERHAFFGVALVAAVGAAELAAWLT